MAKSERIADLEHKIESRWDDYYQYKYDQEKVQLKVDEYSRWISQAILDINEMESLLSDLKEDNESSTTNTQP